MAIGRRRTMGRAAGILLGALGLLGAATSSAVAADSAVSISGFSYSPASLTVAVGDTVTWTNSDAQAHTASADDDSWDTGIVANGASGSVTFSTAGVFAYHCDIHPEMTGSVTVQAAPTGSGPGATAPPTDGLVDDLVPTDGGLGALAIVATFAIGLVVAVRRFGRAA